MHKKTDDLASAFILFSRREGKKTLFNQINSND
jgi:hypothetical protein